MDLTYKAFKSVRQLALAGFALAMVTSHAVADNQAALKDAIGNSKVAEAKPVEAKAAAITTPSTVEADFKKLDSNSDLKISLKEAVKDKSLAAQFDASDANHDGMLSTEEYTTYKSTMAIKPVEGAVNTVN